MTTWLSSLRDFSIGLFGRWYLLLSAILLALPNLLERSSGIESNPPTGLLWTIIGLSVFAIQFAYEPNSQLRGEEQFVADIRELQINPWLEFVRDELTPGELNIFDCDPGRSSVNDIDIDLFTDLKGLRRHLAERVNRLDDICEGIRHAS